MQKQNFIGTAVGGILLNTLVNAITEKLIQKPTVPVDRSNVGIVRPEIREAVAEAITTDPVIVNELNGEKPIQSRVLWGNFLAGVGTTLAGAMPLAIALGILTPQEGQAILDGWGAIVSAGGAVIGMCGVLYSVYGRLASGLKPLFSRKARA